MARQRRAGPDYRREAALLALGIAPVAGIDEAGRGPWAGPVVAAAVVLERGRIPAGLDDSKVLRPAERVRLHGEIMACAEVGIGIVEADRIDLLDILQATLLAMAIAVDGLAAPPRHALVDGNRAPRLACPVTTIIGGDAASVSIAAASIIAKVTRDAIMAVLAGRHPGYGFERHKGYGTAEHAAALARLGASPCHRRSFAPVRSALDAATKRA